MGAVQRQILRGVLGVVGRPRLTLAVAAGAFVACAALAYARLDISTDQNRLFNPEAKFFAAYLDFDRKFPENEAIYVVVEPADPNNVPPVDRWTGLADAVENRLRGLPEHVRLVEARVPIEQLGDQGLLFEHPASVAQRVAEVRQFMPLVRLWAERPGPLMTRVLGPTPTDRFLAGQLAPGVAPDAEQARFVGMLAEHWSRTLDPARRGPALPDLARFGATSPRDLGYFYVPDESDPERRRQVLLVRVYPRRQYASLTAISRTVEAIRAAVREAAGPFGEFRVGVTGRPALEADEMRTTDRDSTRAEVVALSVVFVGLALFLRSIWLAVVAELSLVAGIGWTFGWAELAVGELNLLSIVFLIALIGIGMDYLVQILVRYRQEAAHGRGARGVWARVFRHVGPPINTACLGAAGAFLVAVFTDFRGAAELGIIAGGGLLLCLLAGYTVLPAMLVLFPGRFARRQKQVDARRGSRPAGLTASAVAGAALGQTIGPQPRSAPAGGWRLVLPVIWIALLAAGVPFALRAGFNGNLIELQAPDLESTRLVRKLQTWSAVVLSRDLDELRRARDAVKDLPSVAATESILEAEDNAAWLSQNAKLPAIDWAEPMPVGADDLPRLANKARGLAGRFEETAKRGPSGESATPLGVASQSLRRFAERLDGALTDDASRRAAAQRLSAWQRGFVNTLRDTLQQFAPDGVRIDDVPPELRGHFVAPDGTYALYIYPRDDLWDRANLARFMREIEPAVAAAVPGGPGATGIASNLYYTTASIERSFYLATAYALGLIVVLVLIDLRSLRETLMAVSVLALGLPMLVALMGLFGVDWNFANFFGLPILIGAGHEYGVFMVHRYREARDHPRRFWRRWDPSDQALLLCAYVTCSAFGFFALLAQHRGLRSLGVVMALGIACIYLATVTVVRPLLLWQLKRRSGASGGPGFLVRRAGKG